MTTVISTISSLPNNHATSTELVRIVVTSGIPSYFKVTGTELDDIISVDWYPKNPSSLQFVTRPLILLNEQEGTFMIKVTNNYLDITDRGGHLSFRLSNRTNFVYPVMTYGPVSLGPLWTAPQQGLNTG